MSDTNTLADLQRRIDQIEDGTLCNRLAPLDRFKWEICDNQLAIMRAIVELLEDK